MAEQDVEDGCLPRATHPTLMHINKKMTFQKYALAIPYRDLANGNSVTQIQKLDEEEVQQQGCPESTWRH